MITGRLHDIAIRSGYRREGSNPPAPGNDLSSAIIIYALTVIDTIGTVRVNDECYIYWNADYYAEVTEMSAKTENPGAKQKNENVLIVKTKLGERVTEVWHNGVYVVRLSEKFYIAQNPLFVMIGAVSRHNEYVGTTFIDGEDIIVKEVFE